MHRLGGRVAGCSRRSRRRPTRSASARTRSCSARPQRSKVPPRRSARACGTASSRRSTRSSQGRRARPQARAHQPRRRLRSRPSVAQTMKLIEEDKVFALIGAVGTPTAMATIPIASARNVPFIGAFTGAEFLRDSSLTTSSISAPATSPRPRPGQASDRGSHFTRIAIFYQDDSFGRDGLAGVKRALEKRSMDDRRRHLRAQHLAVGAALAHDQARRAGSGRHGRHLRPVRRVHQARAQQRLQPDLRQHLLRRLQRARQGARPARRGRRRHAGRAVSQGPSIRVVAAIRRRSRRSTRRWHRIRVARRLSGRPPRPAALENAGPRRTRESLRRAISDDIGRFDISGQRSPTVARNWCSRIEGSE